MIIDKYLTKLFKTFKRGRTSVKGTVIKPFKLIEQKIKTKKEQ